MKRLTLLAIIAGVMVMMFALTLGVASADEFTSGDPNEAGINQAIDNGEANHPVGQHVVGPNKPAKDRALVDPDTPSNAGTKDGGLSHNPLCPLHPEHDNP